ncbi:hypothetical protein J2S05_003327 [Alkalicoccobacillus murimartini]|uniref:Uncharacterized protein n=1 Tax=Alkalicoccobacillus murimartini TaxID=171685 RepID=A0ABT9YLZ0_9BACI|nr:hypothetical protein [Alkalicoccobacillus murimartini]
MMAPAFYFLVKAIHLWDYPFEPNPPFSHKYEHEYYISKGG